MKVITRRSGARTAIPPGNHLVGAITSDPRALAQLGDALIGHLSVRYSPSIVDAIEQIVTKATAKTAGRVIPGKISTSSGALQLNGSSQAIAAMVFLNGAATAISCYVPTHLRSAIATGQEVWCMPINGNMSDVMILSLRNIF